MLWERLKTRNRLVLAPLAGWSDLAFRLVAKEYGVGLVYTEMVSAAGLIRREPKTWSLLRSHPVEQPLVVQIFGDDPKILSQAAVMVEAAGFQALDLNLGCPVAKVVRQGAGAALLRDLGRVEEVFSRVRAAVSIPVLAKIRSGWSETDGPVALETARLAQAAGLDGLVLHPRFARQGFGGRADWDLLAQVAGAVNLPVIGSGDVTTPNEAAGMLAQTGCAGVMVGRAALGAPWLLGQILDRLAGRAAREVELDERRRVMIRHLALMTHYSGEWVSRLKFRGLAGFYFKGLPHARRVRHSIHQADTTAQTAQIIDRYFDELTASREAA